MKHERRRSTTAQRVKTSLALVVALLAALVWWSSRREPPTATSESVTAGVRGWSSGSDSDRETESAVLELDTRARAPVPAVPDVGESQAARSVDPGCATIDVRVTVGRNVEEVSNFACTFQRASDQMPFRAQAIGPRLSYCLELAKPHGEDVFVSVRHDRFGTACQRVRALRGKRVELHLRLPGNGRVRGLVVDEKREPIADAWVFSGTRHRMQLERATELFEPLELDRVPDAVLTDVDGAFELELAHACVTALHDEHTTLTVAAEECELVVLRRRLELGVQLLDDSAQPWSRAEIALDGARPIVADLLGRAYFAAVERGARGMTLPDGRVVGVLVPPPSASEVQIGPWISGARIKSQRTLRELRSARGVGTLVGLDGAFSIVSLHAGGSELTIDAILPGSYLLVTTNGYFAYVTVHADGRVDEPDKKLRAALQVEAPAGSRVYVFPDGAHELVERVCLLVAGREVRWKYPTTWESLPRGRWRVSIEGGCAPTVVDVTSDRQTVSVP